MKKLYSYRTESNQIDFKYYNTKSMPASIEVEVVHNKYLAFFYLDETDPSMLDIEVSAGLYEEGYDAVFDASAFSWRNPRHADDPCDENEVFLWETTAGGLTCRTNELETETSFDVYLDDILIVSLRFIPDTYDETIIVAGYADGGSIPAFEAEYVDHEKVKDERFPAVFISASEVESEHPRGGRCTVAQLKEALDKYEDDAQVFVCDEEAGLYKSLDLWCDVYEAEYTYRNVYARRPSKFDPRRNKQ